MVRENYYIYRYKDKFKDISKNIEDDQLSVQKTIENIFGEIRIILHQ